jgi:hypothetical protein
MASSNVLTVDRDSKRKKDISLPKPPNHLAKIAAVVNDDQVLNNKIEIVAKDIEGSNWIKNALKDRDIISSSNANTICDYVLAMKSESNISATTRRNLLTTLLKFLKWANLQYYKTPSVSFRDMTHETVKLYLESLQKSEELDPTHKWIGSHNVIMATIQKFYRWFYFPNTKSDERPLPDQVSASHYRCLINENFCYCKARFEKKMK